MIIEFHDAGEPAELPAFASKDDLIDRSFSHSKTGLGALRLVGANNARYGKKHPVLTPDGDVVGYLKDGTWSLGYTWNCVYVGRVAAFFLSTIPVGCYGNNGGWLSIVQSTGKFLFSREVKFEKTKSIKVTFGDDWGAKVFKLLANQERLFLLTGTGFGLVDTLQQQLVYDNKFDSTDHRSVQHMSISPNEKLLAILFRSMDYQDPVSDEWKFKNYIKIFEISTGRELGYYDLSNDKWFSAKVQFSSDGKALFLDGRIGERELSYQRRFDLVTRLT